MNSHDVSSRKKKAPISRQIIYVAALMAIIALAVFWYVRFPRLSIPNLGENSKQRAANIASSWKNGNVIVFIRHAERCDRSETPCMNDPDGITTRGRDQAISIGKAFEKLDIQRVDVFTSPSTRTKQTAAYLFKAAATESELLTQCKTITFDEVANSKTVGRNLVLVTHDHCIERLEQLINIKEYKETTYSSLLFVSLDEKSKAPIAAELIDATKFLNEFASAEQAP